MPFDVVATHDDTIIRGTYETGSEANLLATCLNEAERESGSSTRFRILKRKDEEPTAPPAWHDREMRRFWEDTYKPVPWIGEPWHGPSGCGYAGKLNHFPHVATGDPTKIAFTADNDAGERDIQRRMRVGRYLAQYFGDVLSEDHIKDLCATWDIAQGIGLEVKFATEPTDIVRVYVNGPDSCMSHPTNDYECSGHPVRVYGAGDLAIAYLENDERITARAICWPAKKLFGRLYGDASRLRPLMEALDYEHTSYTDHFRDPRWNGARLLRIEEDHGFVCPWLDHVGLVDDNGEYLVISTDGKIDAQETGGVIACNLTTCDSCGERYNSENGGAYVDEQDLCDSCYENDTFYCDHCDRHHIGEGRYCEESSRTYCDRCWDDTHHDCTECSSTHHHDNLTSDVNGEQWCEECAENATRNEYGEIDPDYVDPDDEPSSPTIHHEAQLELSI